jgi:glycosyltransferase involved in cell wall biosynthesis
VNWEKGLDRLLAALPRVPACDLIVAGNDEAGYQHRLEAIASELGVRERISFIGPVYGAQKSALLKRASALILPSYSENFGNVVLEAMAEGCPAIVTPEVGASEIVQRTGGGVVVEGRPDTLAAGINALLAEPHTLRQMAERARSAIDAQYTWNAIARTTERIYRRIVAERPRDAAALHPGINISSK